jgi:hypothetical protein
MRLLGWLVVAVLLAPVVFAGWVSFSPDSFLTPPTGDWSGRWYMAFASDRRWIAALGRSLVIATLAAAVALAAGTPLAIAVARYRFRGAVTGCGRGGASGVCPSGRPRDGAPSFTVRGWAVGEPGRACSGSRVARAPGRVSDRTKPPRPDRPGPGSRRPWAGSRIVAGGATSDAPTPPSRAARRGSDCIRDLPERGNGHRLPVDPGYRDSTSCRLAAVAVRSLPACCGRVGGSVQSPRLWGSGRCSGSSGGGNNDVRPLEGLGVVYLLTRAQRPAGLSLAVRGAHLLGIWKLATTDMCSGMWTYSKTGTPCGTIGSIGWTTWACWRICRIARGPGKSGGGPAISLRAVEFEWGVDYGRVVTSPTAAARNRQDGSLGRGATLARSARQRQTRCYTGLRQRISFL